MADDNREAKMIAFGGLWVQVSKGGARYFAGNFGRARILIFKNGFKKEEKHPDYVMYLAPDNKEQGDREGANRQEKAEDDDLPF